MKTVTLAALHKVRRVEPRGQASYMIHEKLAVREQCVHLMENIYISVMPFTYYETI